MATRKRTKGRQRKKGAGKSPAPFFARSQPASTAVFARAPRQPPIDPNANRRRQVIILLEHAGVYPSIAREIAAMEPDLPYILRIYAVNGSPHGKFNERSDYQSGETPILQATFVGTGLRLWSRAIGYARNNSIEDVLIEQLKGLENSDRRFKDAAALWGKDSVKTVKGERVYGSGQFTEYRDRLKTGRPKKAGGGMTASERRKNRKSKNAALARDRETEARAKRLEDLGDMVGAARLRIRAKAACKVDR